MSKSQFTKSELKIQHAIRVASIVGAIAAIFLALAPTAISLTIDFTAKRDMLRQNLIENHKMALKNRVDNFAQMIEKQRKLSLEKWKDRTKTRVQYAIAVAESIYDRNKGSMSDDKIKRLIVETLSTLRQENGEPYVVIIDKNLRGILTMNPKYINKDVGFLKDQTGESLIGKKVRETELKGEAFFSYSSPTYSEPFGKPRPQMSFSQMFDPFGWMFESVSYLDELEERLKKELLELLSQMRYNGTNYIFIDTYDGYALLNNGRALDKPEYIWDLTDPNGVKIIQEQLKIALERPEGGFLQYEWFEKELNENRPYISYVRAIPEWKWKIGSGSYMDDIDRQIAVQEAELWRGAAFGAIVLLAFAFGVVVCVFVGAYWINGKIRLLFDDMSDELEDSQKELVELNERLQTRVELETEKRLKNEEMLMRSSKLADMGNMMGLIAHQWKQPLNALTMTIDEFEEASGDKARIADLIAECQRLIAYMTDTITDFRNFLKPETKQSSFSLNELLISTGKLISSRLKTTQTKLELPENDLKITSYRNDLRQVLINLYGNACDANEARIKLGEIKEGFIKIESEVKDGFVFVRVGDSGGGVPSDMLEAIFNPYITTKGEKGTGLGLYMSRRIVEERVKGTLTVQNGAEGAIFTMTIPIV